MTTPMSIALDNGLEVTTLHDHCFRDSPKVMFMHIGGSGDPEQLAEPPAKAGVLGNEDLTWRRS